tara:strand:- start:131 stop:502 length:372 start_codon:yes stop_codon:yes gene_type:complete
MNQTNLTNGPATDNTNNQLWEESGAMVYVALTVATLSAIIMCCVWFLKQRVNTRYGSLDTHRPEEQVELRRSVPQETGSKSRSDVFTLEASESDSEEVEEAEEAEEADGDALQLPRYTDTEAV